MKNLVVLVLGLILASTSAIAQNAKERLSPVGFEHVRVNVADKQAIARWYVDTMGLEIVPSSNKDVVYVADKDRNFMFEFSSIPNRRVTYADLPVDGFHVAFDGDKTIEKIAEKMLGSGATADGAVSRNAIGDYVFNVRDPNGLVIQLISRVLPFYEKPAKSPIRFEHIGLNVPGQLVSALWFVEFMDLQLPWSKDMDEKANNFRNYRVPYVGDAARKMSMELYDKKSIDYSYAKLSHEESHLAFSTQDPERLAKRMAYGGARQVSPLRTEPNGDQVIDLLDPRNFPVRLIKRKSPVLN